MSPPKVCYKMIFLFPIWNMLVSWRILEVLKGTATKIITMGPTGPLFSGWLVHPVHLIKEKISIYSKTQSVRKVNLVNQIKSEFLTFTERGNILKDSIIRDLGDILCIIRTIDIDKFVYICTIFFPVTL